MTARFDPPRQCGDSEIEAAAARARAKAAALEATFNPAPADQSDAVTELRLLD